VTAAARDATAQEAMSDIQNPANAALAIGFHNPDAPLGARFWFMGRRIGLDFGAGYSIDEPQNASGHLVTFNLDGGIPITIGHWDRLRLIARPGVLFQSRDDEILREDVDGNPLPSIVERNNTVVLRGEIETEFFLIDRMSVSIGYGAQYNPAGTGSSESFSSFGSNLFDIGLHVYLWSGK
jgi:hypothetical protein